VAFLPGDNKSLYTARKWKNTLLTHQFFKANPPMMYVTYMTYECTMAENHLQEDLVPGVKLKNEWHIYKS